MEKRILQIILGMIGIVPIVTGLMGILPPGVSDDFYSIPFNHSIPGNIILDSNYRYYSGVWFGVGILIFWIIPSIEKHKTALPMISVLIFSGGVGRIFSMITCGIPSTLFVIFTILELIFPTLILLQYRVIKQSKPI